MKANPAAFCLSRVCGLGLAMAASSSQFDARNFKWLAQLPRAWDQRRELRERSINGQNLLRGLRQPGHGSLEVVAGTLDCCKLNVEAIGAVLKLMADNACIFVPKVFMLQAAAIEFHGLAGYADPDSLGAAASSDGWGLKRMLSFLKRKWRRSEKCRASCLSRHFFGPQEVLETTLYGASVQLHACMRMPASVLS